MLRGSREERMSATCAPATGPQNCGNATPFGDLPFYKRARLATLLPVHAGSGTGEQAPGAVPTTPEQKTKAAVHAGSGTGVQAPGAVPTTPEKETEAAEANLATKVHARSGTGVKAPGAVPTAAKTASKTLHASSGTGVKAPGTVPTAAKAASKTVHARSGTGVKAPSAVPMAATTASKTLHAGSGTGVKAPGAVPTAAKAASKAVHARSGTGVKAPGAVPTAAKAAPTAVLAWSGTGVKAPGAVPTAAKAALKAVRHTERKIWRAGVLEARKGEGASFCASPRAELQCYGVLGITRSATAAEVRHAYRRKSLQVHPDKGGDTSAFLSVAEAFETLSQSRQAYDTELDVFGSSDGRSASSGLDATSAPSEIYDLVALVQALCEASPDEWQSHIDKLPSSSLRHMLGLIANPGRPAKRPRTFQEGSDKAEFERAVSQLDYIYFDNQAYRVKVNICGLSVCSNYTRCFSTLAQWHISVVTLKEVFRAHRSMHADRPVEEAFRVAFAQARSQQIYVLASDFRIYFDLRVRGSRVQTPGVHSLDLALEHRRQVLAIKEMGGQAMSELRLQFKQTSKTIRLKWQALVRQRQELLQGYILRELHKRAQIQTLISGRFRLSRKQSVSYGFEKLPALQWLNGPLVDKATSMERARDCARSFPNAGGPASLQQLLQVQQGSALPRSALQCVNAGEFATNFTQKRKLSCMTHDNHGQAAKGKQRGARKRVQKD